MLTLESYIIFGIPYGGFVKTYKLFFLRNCYQPSVIIIKIFFEISGVDLLTASMKYMPYTGTAHGHYIEFESTVHWVRFTVPGHRLIEIDRCNTQFENISKKWRQTEKFWNILFTSTLATPLTMYQSKFSSFNPVLFAGYAKLGARQYFRPIIAHCPVALFQSLLVNCYSD